MDGSGAMVRESGTVGLVGSQRDSLMDGPGSGTGLMGNLAWRGVGDGPVWALALALELGSHSGHTL